MLRMIFRFALLAAVAAAVAWLADRPGRIAVDWLGHRIETSLGVALIALAIALIALWALWAILRRLIHAPGAVSDYFRLRRRRRGFDALSRGMVAVAAGDRDAARRQAELAVRVLPDDPLARLLEAQTAQLSGDYRRVGRVFEDMLANPETELVALRGLYAQARQTGDEARARQLAERAYRRNPGLEWASNAMLMRHAAERDWPAVLAVLDAQRRSRLLDEATANRKRAVVLTAQALAAEPVDPEAALELAGKALKLDPGLVPAAALAGRLHFAAGALRRGLKAIERAWAINPHPDLADAYAHARPGDSAQDRLARIRDLLKASPGGEEGAIALARAAIEARDWQTARSALAPYAAGRPRARVCTLMAEIEEGEFGDKGRAREWLARAVTAPRDPVWVADGFVADEWQPISPVTGELGSFTWKVPLEGIGYTAPAGDEAAVPLPPVIEVERLPPAPTAQMGGQAKDEAPPAPQPAPEPVREPQSPPQPQAKLRPEPHAAAVVEEPALNPAATAEKSRQPRTASPGPAHTTPQRQPDDPGPPETEPDTGWMRKLAGG